jgi:hypothetical protein
VEAEMANGFIGNASKSYFSTVQDASQNSAGTMASIGMSGSGSGVSYDDGQSYPTGIGNRSNIAVDDDLYATVLRRIEQSDEDMALTLRDVIAEVRKMCETDFIIPDTIPRVNATIGAVEQTLHAFHDITSQATGVMRNFVSQVGANDRG